MENLNIPNKCAECPLMKHAQNTQELRERKRVLVQVAAQQAMTLDVEGLGEMIGPAGIESLPDEVAQGLVDFLKSSPEEVFQQLDSEEVESQVLVARHTKNCEGSVKLRATTRGINYMVTLCGSPHMPTGLNCEDTHVVRKRDA